MTSFKKKNSLENTAIKKLKLIEYGNIDKILQPIRNTINNHWKYSQTVLLNKKEEKISSNIPTKFYNQKTFFNLKNFNEDTLFSKKIFNSTAKTNLTTQANSITIPSFFHGKSSKQSERSVTSYVKSKNKKFSIADKKVLMQKLFQTYENEQYISNEPEKNIVFYNANNLRDMKIIIDSPTPQNNKKIEQSKKSFIQLKSLKIPKKNSLSDNELRFNKSTRTPKSIMKYKHTIINFSISEKEENDLFCSKKLGIKKKLTDKEIIKNNRILSNFSQRKTLNEIRLLSSINKKLLNNQFSANLSPNKLVEEESSISSENRQFERKRSLIPEMNRKMYSSKEFQSKNKIDYQIRELEVNRNTKLSKNKLSEKSIFTGISGIDHFK